MARLAASLLLAAVLRCSSGPETSTQAPPDQALVAVDEAPPCPSPGPPPTPPPRAPRRPSPAIVQALAELERNPDLHLVVVGPRAQPVRKAMLRAARGRIDDARIRVDDSDPAAAAAAGDVQFRFFVPPPAPTGPGSSGLHDYMPQ